MARDDRAPEAIAIMARCGAAIAPEEPTKKCEVFIADGQADVLDRYRLLFQQVLCRLDTYAMKVRQRRIAGCRLEAPRKIARAHPHARRQFLHPELPPEFLE